MSKKERKICEFEMYLNNFFCLRSNLSNDNNNFCLKAMSETGVENYIFWPEIGSGFEEPGGTPRQKFPGVPPTPGKNNKTHLHKKG